MVGVSTLMPKCNNFALFRRLRYRYLKRFIP